MKDRALQPRIVALGGIPDRWNDPSLLDLRPKELPARAGAHRSASSKDASLSVSICAAILQPVQRLSSAKSESKKHTVDVRVRGHRRNQAERICDLLG
jgi:hypothetical protein